MWRISRETAAERIRTLIDVSDQAAIATYGGFVVMVCAGIAAGFMANFVGARMDLGIDRLIGGDLLADGYIRQGVFRTSLGSSRRGPL